MEQSYLILEDRKLAYCVHGEGLPLVLLHGFCGSGAYWDDVVSRLAESYKVIVPDLRGHGASDTPSGPYTMEELAADIAELIKRLDLGRAVVLGHSLGGYVTLALAEQHAELLSGFGLIHSTAYPDDEQGKLNRMKAKQTIEEKGIGAFAEGLVPKLFAPGHLETMRAAVDKAMTIARGTSADGAASTIVAMKERPDRRAVLQNTELPVLLVAGALDQIIPKEKTFTASGDHVVHRLIDSAGHMSMMEAPEELTRIVLEFMSSKLEQKQEQV
ncbi:alpha/beta fold hydrolase [Paenibacillus sp. YYML68]|uniref:alpha/beta fold hydrolase n=1 Tax=Paenibacillus sp. YYML68 TaxID=2909250 RepID=UPI00248F8927|nr:alpha/beta hydrolase [Paenibacillus sp. YYML68]